MMKVENCQNTQLPIFWPWNTDTKSTSDVVNNYCLFIVTVWSNTVQTKILKEYSVKQLWIC